MAGKEGAPAQESPIMKGAIGFLADMGSLFLGTGLSAIGLDDMANGVFENIGKE